VISTKAAALTEGALKTMLLGKFKMAMAVVMAVVILVLGLGFVAALAAEPTATPVQRGKKQEGKVKWEYKAIPASDIEKLAPKGSEDTLTDGLNTLGEQGWELVAVVPSTPEMLQIGGGGGGFGGPPIPGGGGPGGPLMLPAPKLKPSIYLFKRPK